MNKFLLVLFWIVFSSSAFAGVHSKRCSNATGSLIVFEQGIGNSSTITYTVNGSDLELNTVIEREEGEKKILESIAAPSIGGPTRTIYAVKLVLTKQENGEILTSDYVICLQNTSGIAPVVPSLPEGPVLGEFTEAQKNLAALEILLEWKPRNLLMVYQTAANKIDKRFLAIFNEKWKTLKQNNVLDPARAFSMAREVWEFEKINNNVDVETEKMYKSLREIVRELYEKRDE